MARRNKIEWMTTAPNPRVISHTADAGQRGWRTHALVIRTEKTLGDLRYLRSVCGIRAAHGWGMDLFIEQKCARCVRMLKGFDGSDGS